MDSDNVGWDSHYEKIRDTIDYESFLNSDQKTPYVKRLTKFGKDKKCSLEFGSGKGGLSLILKKKFPKIELHLLDLEEDAIKFSKGLFKHYNLDAQFYVDDFMKLPFPDNHFDLIHGNTVLEHVPDTKKAVTELVRVLKKDGHILVTVPNSNRKFSGHDLYHNINRFNYFSRTFFPKELESFFTENSCEIVDRFGNGCVYFYPSYLPRYVMEKIRSRKQSSINYKKDESETVKSSSIYSSKERKLYASTFSIADRIWEPIQKKINHFTSENEFLPYPWYITIGIVARKI
mgnify:CR=1 FL=1|jgi:ubiquinone/menaquinone biosynthesis C-methylase UbiE